MTAHSQQQTLAGYIEQYSLHEHLNPDLLRCLRIYPFAPQQKVYAALSEQTHLYFLVSGKFQISYYLANGKRSIIQVLRPFAIIGDLEFFEDTKLLMDVIAVEASVFLGLRKADVFRYGYDDPRFLRFIIRGMSDKIRSSGFNQLRYDLPLINRVAIYLLNQPMTDNRIITESKTLIADLLGTTTRHLNRTIHTLEDHGIIQWRRQVVTIHDRDRLQAYDEL